MPNLYDNLLSKPSGRRILKLLGLPTPVALERYQMDQTSFVTGAIGIFSTPASYLSNALTEILNSSEISLHWANEQNNLDTNLTYKAFVFDATGLQQLDELQHLYQFFNANIRRLAQCGRVIILGSSPSDACNAQQAAVSQALEGFNRSLAKEIGKRGATSQLVFVSQNGYDNLAAPLQFLLSPKSAYISGQTLTTNASGDSSTDVSWQQPLQGKVALVTGASRGIGESIARTLARDGATVIGLDIPPAEAALTQVMTEINGNAILADITADDAAQHITEHLKAFNGLDILVHNAGITRDKTIANMPEHWWQQTLDINLNAIARINNELLANGELRANSRIICVSSMNGIAGQVGQTNYATSKAGVIGYVRHMAKALSEQQITVNAVAPGFIETAMTDEIPFMTREFGRRLNSLSQGGKPIDVAEAISFFAHPNASGVSGQVLRICGQSIIGA